MQKYRREWEDVYLILNNFSEDEYRQLKKKHVPAMSMISDRMDQERNTIDTAEPRRTINRARVRVRENIFSFCALSRLLWFYYLLMLSLDGTFFRYIIVLDKMIYIEI